MSEIELILQRWKQSLCDSVSAGGQFARNPTAHKWKATYRSLVLRETVFWRTHDLLTQVIYFTKNEAEEVVLLTLYAKSKTDNLTGPVLKEIRRALED